MKERNHAFDLLCGLCILRMLMLHSISLCGFRGEFWFGKIMAWTFFFMSFFFFKAGYFNKTVAGNSWTYLKDKSKRLLVPYLAWGLIGSIIYFGFVWGVGEHFEKAASRLTWAHVYRQSHFYGDPPCWFLVSFFMTYVVVHFVEKGLNKLRTMLEGAGWQQSARTIQTMRIVSIAACPFVSFLLWKNKNPMWLSLNNVFMGIYFFYLGRLWRWLQTRVSKQVIITLSVALILCFITGNKLWHGEYDMSLNKFVQNPWGAGINTTFALCGISGLLLSLPIGRIPVVNYIGQHSMVYFVAHYPLIYFYKFTHQAFGRAIWGHWDEWITLAVFIMAICTWLVPHVESVPWLSGRYKKVINQL